MTASSFSTNANFGNIGARRLYYLLVESYNAAGRISEMVTFHSELLAYIDSEFLCLPLMEKNKLWKTMGNKLVMIFK